MSAEKKPVEIKMIKHGRTVKIGKEWVCFELLAHKNDDTLKDASDFLERMLNNVILDYKKKGYGGI